MFLSLPILGFFIFSALAQVLISDSLPACGQQCPVLLQAQAGCVPPAAPVTNQNIYQSCFCQSTFLVPLLAGGTSTLCTACSPAEMGTIQTWYQGSCAAPNQPPPEEQPAPPPQTTTTSKAAAPTRAQNPAQEGATISDRPPPNNRGWYVSPSFTVLVSALREFASGYPTTGDGFSCLLFFFSASVFLPGSVGIYIAATTVAEMLKEQAHSLIWEPGDLGEAFMTLVSWT